MTKTKKRWALGGLALVALSIWGGVAAMAIEQPDYKVTREYERFEVREYGAYLVAEATVQGTHESSGNKAFSILAGYIFGGNQGKQKIAMTAPVTNQSADATTASTATEGVRSQGEKIAMTAPVTNQAGDGEGEYVYRFIMPSKHTLETLPTPNDSRVTLREVPAKTVAVRRYSGSWGERKYRRQLEILREAMRDEGLEPTGEPIFARYNSPYALPMFRRNEIMIEIVPQSEQ